MKKMFVAAFLIGLTCVAVGKKSDAPDFYKFRWGDDVNNLYIAIAKHYDGLFTHIVACKYNRKFLFDKEARILLLANTNDLLIGGGYLIRFKKIYATQYSNAAFQFLKKKYGKSFKSPVNKGYLCWNKKDRTMITLVASESSVVIAYESLFTEKEILAIARKKKRADLKRYKKSNNL